MAFVSYTEKLSFYAACFLLGATIVFFSIPALKPIVIGYFSILWALFILHRLFFIIAPPSWQQNLNKRLSVRLEKMVDITPQKMKSAIIWRLSRLDVLLFWGMILLLSIFWILMDFIPSLNKNAYVSTSEEMLLDVKNYKNLYNLGLYSSIFTIFLSILFSFFTFFRSFSSKISFRPLYIAIVLLFFVNLMGFSAYKTQIISVLALFLLSLPIGWNFCKSLFNKRYPRLNAIMNCVVMGILILNLPTLNESILGDVITLLCLPIIGFFWANSAQTPFDTPSKTSFELTLKSN